MTLDQLLRLCAHCHQFPKMADNPGEFCSVCDNHFRLRAAWEQEEAAQQELRQQAERWQETVQGWAADAQIGGGA